VVLAGRETGGPRHLYLDKQKFSLADIFNRAFGDLTNKKLINITYLGFKYSVVIQTNQGYNARKVVSEVYASFVLQCTVSGR